VTGGDWRVTGAVAVVVWALGAVVGGLVGWAVRKLQGKPGLE